MPQIFISHSSKNDPYAQKVRDAVVKNLTDKGFEVLIDQNRLEPTVRCARSCSGGWVPAMEP